MAYKETSGLGITWDLAHKESISQEPGLGRCKPVCHSWRAASSTQRIYAKARRRPLSTSFGNTTWSDSHSYTLMYSTNGATLLVAACNCKHTYRPRCLALPQPAWIAWHRVHLSRQIWCSTPLENGCKKGIFPINSRIHSCWGRFFQKNAVVQLFAKLQLFSTSKQHNLHKLALGSYTFGCMTVICTCWATRKVSGVFRQQLLSSLLSEVPWSISQFQAATWHAHLTEPCELLLLLATWEMVQGMSVAPQPSKATTVLQVWTHIMQRH